MSPIIEAMKPSPNSDRQSCASLGELFPKNGTAFATESPTTFVSSRPTIFGSSRRPGIAGNLAGNFFKKWPPRVILASKTRAASIAYKQIPCSREQGFFCTSREFWTAPQGENREFCACLVSVNFSHTCFGVLPDAICSPLNFADEENKMADEILIRTRYGEAFWRAQHEGLRRSEFINRGDCRAQGTPPKASGNRGGASLAPPPPTAEQR